MASNSIVYQTHLPQNITDLIVEHCAQWDNQTQPATVVQGPQSHSKNDTKRITDVAWIPTTEWLGGFIWFYIQECNRMNFKYDLTTIDVGSMQYSVYNPGAHYIWHTDAGLAELYQDKYYPQWNKPALGDYVTPKTEYVRKLSFSLQLSHPDDYTGGQLQLLTGVMGAAKKLETASTQQGTLIIFDSRTPHRVTKIKSGQRKALVGWAVGPRWK